MKQVFWFLDRKKKLPNQIRLSRFYKNLPYQVSCIDLKLIYVGWWGGRTFHKQLYFYSTCQDTFIPYVMSFCLLAGQFYWTEKVGFIIIHYLYYVQTFFVNLRRGGDTRTHWTYIYFFQNLEYFQPRCTINMWRHKKA